MSYKLSPVIFLILLFLGLGFPGMAQEPQGSANPLFEKVRFEPRFLPDPAIVSYEEGASRLPPAVRDGWLAFLSEQGGTWRGYFDERHGGLEFAEGSGIPWLPRLPGVGQGKQADLATLEGLARGFVAKIRPLLPLAPGDELVLNTDRSLEVADYLWYVDFDVHRGGRPIAGARVNFRVNNGNLTQFGTENLPAATFAAPAVETSREQALAKLAGELGLDLAGLLFRNPGSLELLPRNLGSADAPGGFEPGKGRDLVAVWQFEFQQPQKPEVWRARVDAGSGGLVEFVEISHTAQALGGVRLSGHDHDTVLPMPFVDVDLAAGLYSDGSGRFAAGDALSSTLTGRYFTVLDHCGDLSLEPAASGDLFFGVADPLMRSSCANPGVGGRGNTRSARTQFYTLNRAREMARSWLPSRSWLEGEVPVEVNIPPSSNFICNAQWNGFSLRFNRASGGCTATGEDPGIGAHELGHGLDQHDGNGSSPDPGTGETYGDFLAALLAHRSCVGANYRTTHCSGFGNACLDCRGVRDIDWDRHAAHAPSTVASFTQALCPAPPPEVPNYVGPCRKEGHCESQVASEALWDFVARDFLGGPGGPGGDRAAAWDTAQRLWFLSRPTATSAFSCNPRVEPWTSHGCTNGSLFRVLRAVDDDDGNLANGTPHGAALFAAFDRHGIACASDAGAGVTFSGCAPPAAPDLVWVLPGTRNTSLAWLAAGADLVFDVFRSELGCDAGFVRIASGLRAPSFEDAPAVPGMAYSYQVVARRAGNGACSSPPSACRTVAVPYGADPWSQDTPEDGGAIDDPATRGRDLYESQDVWVRHEDDGDGEHQDPRSGDNWIYVRVRNRGWAPAYNVPVKIYGAPAATGLAWPADWRELGTVVVPLVRPDSEAPGGVLAKLRWTPSRRGHYCLLVRIVAPYDMPFGETGDVDFNTRQNNNIVWRNLNVPSVMGLRLVDMQLYVRSLSPQQAGLTRLSLLDAGPSGAFLGRGRIEVRLPAALVAAWEQAGRPGKGFARTGPETFELVDPLAAWFDFPLAPREEHEIGLTFEDEAEGVPANPSAATYRLSVVQSEASGKRVGGVTYLLTAPKP